LLLENELKRSAENNRPGIGLSAPQIGILKKVAIVEQDNKYLYFANCDIINKKHQQIFINEGCLSFPDKSENTLRYNHIEVVNNIFNPEPVILKGLTAVICQHEVDHWNGSVFFDHKYKKIGLNEPCICGSGKKYKKCCRK
jgi:peptide deformylase